MNIVVCLKVDEGDIGPFDAAALEAALRMENARVTVLSMAPHVAGPVLRALLRLGVERVILLCDKAFAGADTLATSYVLSLAIQKLQPDLVLCGRQSMSGDTAQTGPSVAARLGWSLIPYALSLEVRDGELRCDVRGGTLSRRLPALVTVERIHPLRLPRAFGGHGEQFEQWSAADIAADPSRCGQSGSPTRVVKTFESNRGRRRCSFAEVSDLPQLIAGHRTIAAAPLVLAQPKEKLPLVWTVGDVVCNIAGMLGSIAETVDGSDVSQLARLAAIHRPDAILFPATSWGRVIAPQLAVALETGLCADCTSLEVENGELVMIRPACGGRLMGRIRCATKPALATVRVADKTGGDLIVAIGRGAAGLAGHAAACAAQLGGELAASRGAVDMGLAPYRTQVGLTGRFVSPGVYLALGISGQLEHTCAIEASGLVIAVNHDRDARIFSYADYGVVCDVAAALEMLIKGG